MTESYDVVIIGGGHNGLVCAAYLAGAGLKVTVLERRGVVGGAAVTEEFHPGFRNSIASYTVSLLNPKVIARPASCTRHGLQHRRAADRRTSCRCRRPAICMLGDGRTAGARSRSSPRATPSGCRRTTRRGSRPSPTCCANWCCETPPNVPSGGWLGALPELLKAAGLGSGCARLDMRGAARPARPVHQVGGRLPRRLVRERSDQGRCSASTRWSATTPAPTRRARPTCCCTTCSAR